MAYTKKRWVNIPNAHELTEEELNAYIPEGQDALARFDAENMNRIEDGISDLVEKCEEHLNGKSNPHNVTSSQIGALSKTIPLVEQDILSISTDGWYYTVNCTNTPISGNGYMRVMNYGNNYRIVEWRQNSLHTEYINVLNNNQWLGWVQNFTNKGGTLTGDLKIQKSEQPLIQLEAGNFSAHIFKNANNTNDYGLTMKDCNDVTNPDSHVYLRLSHSQAKKSLAEALRLGVFTSAEEGRFYNVYGEHNLPRPAQIQTGSYAGTGENGLNSNSLTFEFVPQMVVITGTRDDSTWTMFLFNGQKFSFNHHQHTYSLNRFVNHKEYVVVTWDNAAKTVSWGENQTNNPDLPLNAAGVTYNYIAIGKGGKL